MRRVSPWLAVIFFLGCIALGVLVLDQRAIIARTALVGEDLKTSHQQVVDLQHEVGKLRDGEAQAAKEIAQLKQPASVAHSSDGVKVIHMSDILKDHPEFAAIQAKQTRRNVLRQFGDVINSLNLPPEQAAKLKDLLVERQASQTDAQQAAMAAGIERGTPAWNQAINQAGQDVEHDINALLGSDGQSMTFAQLNTRSNYVTQIQNNYAPDFADAGVALSPEQSNAFMQAMATTATDGKAGDNTVDAATGLSPRSQRLLEAASQVLSPAQVQIIKTDLIERNQQQAIMSQYAQGGGPVAILP